MRTVSRSVKAKGEKGEKTKKQLFRKHPSGFLLVKVKISLIPHGAKCNYAS